jgi:site-specific DNA-methyltransferase (adenine-specific)
LKPYYDRDGITIYCGDCREVLPTLQKTDLLLTDPTYGCGYVTSWRSRNHKLRVPIANDHDVSTLAESWPLAIERLCQDRHWYAFASPRMICEVAGIFDGYKSIIAWDKGDRVTVGDLECGFGEAWEAIFYGMKGRRILNGKRPRTVIRYDWSGTMDPLHPTVKPVGIIKKLVAWSTFEGETILDPFMGSGTTLRAAKDMGRKAIGIEIEEKYAEIAARRMEQGVLEYEVADA